MKRRAAIGAGVADLDLGIGDAGTVLLFGTRRECGESKYTRRLG
jgi:hypothetical protein